MAAKEKECLISPAHAWFGSRNCGCLSSLPSPPPGAKLPSLISALKATCTLSAAVVTRALLFAAGTTAAAVVTPRVVSATEGEIIPLEGQQVFQPQDHASFIHQSMQCFLPPSEKEYKWIHFGGYEPCLTVLLSILFTDRSHRQALKEASGPLSLSAALKPQTYLFCLFGDRETTQNQAFGILP